MASIFSLPCIGMEKSSPAASKTIFIRTSDNKRIEMDYALVKYFKVVQQMIEDYSPEAVATQEVPLLIDAEPFSRILKLIATYHVIQHERFGITEQFPAFFDQLMNYSIIDLACILNGLNYLDCKAIFRFVLDRLGAKINESVFLPNQEDIWQALHELLPMELQNLVKESLLLNYKNIEYFIKVTHVFKNPARDQAPSEGLLTKFSKSGRYLKIQHFELFTAQGFTLYDLGANPIRVIGSFRFDNSGFSPNEKYFFVLEYELAEGCISLINLETGKRITIPLTTDAAKCTFSSDSTVLRIDGQHYSVDSGERIPDNALDRTLVFRDNALERDEAAYLEILKTIERRGLRAYDRDSKKFVGFFDPEFWKIKPHVDEICAQLPEEILSGDNEIKISHDARYAFIYTRNPGAHNPPMFRILDLINPRAIKECYSCPLPINSDFNFTPSSDGKMIWLSTKEEDSINRIDIKAVENRADTFERNIVYNCAFEWCALSEKGDRLLVVAKDGTLRLYMKSMDKWVQIQVPHRFDPIKNPYYVPHRLGRKKGEPEFVGLLTAARFADYDSNVILIRAENSVEILHMPVDLLMRHCSLKELIVLIKYMKSLKFLEFLKSTTGTERRKYSRNSLEELKMFSKNPTTGLLNNSYYKQLYDGLHPDVKMMIERKTVLEGTEPDGK